jgi:hypothetical protein
MSEFHHISEFHRIAQTIERGGVAAAEDAVAAIVRQARRLGAPQVLTDLCADRSEPPVARSRAVAKLVGWLQNDSQHKTRLAG